MSAAPLPSGPRQETAVVALDGLVYVLGGFTLASVSDLVEAYDPGTDTWSVRAPLPVPLHHANAAAVSGKVVVLGFLTGEAFAANGAGFAYDPVTDSWATLPSMPSGSERGAAAVGVIGDSVLIAGGFRDGVAVPDTSMFDMSSNVWSSLPALPVARDHGAGVVGNLADPSGVFRDVEVFDPILNRWQIETPLDVGRHGTAGAVVDDTLVVPGGADQQAFGAIASVVVFERGR